MKKSISAILVAALMLFAFTACEQQVPDFQGYYPTMVTVAQNGVIVDGQTATPAMFTATVTYANGEKGAVDGIVTIENGEAIASVTGVDGKAITAKTDVVYTKVQSFAVSGDTQSVTQNGKPDYSKLTLTATYDGGTYTYTSSDRVSVGASSSAVDTSKLGEVVVKPENLEVNSLDLIFAEITAVDWSINVVKGSSTTYDPDLFDHLVVEYAYTDSESKAYTGDTHYTGDKVSVSVYAVDSNGNKSTNKLTKDTDYYYIDEAPTSETGIALTTKSAKTYQIVAKADPATSYDVEIPAGQNYVKTVAIKGADGWKPTEGTRAQVGNFVYTATMAEALSDGETFTYDYSTYATLLDPTVTKTTYAPDFLVKVGKGFADVVKVTVSPAISVENLPTV